jgi:4a-hydroxytetrahydrobiopterin dehydratase
MAEVYSESEVRSRLVALEGWERSRDVIERQYTFATFMAGIEFVNRLARAADELDHHPDIDIRYTRVKLALTTHSAGGITDLDFQMASRADLLADAGIDTDS